MNRFETQLLFLTAALALASSACVEPPSGSSQGTLDLGVGDMGMVPVEVDMASLDADMAAPVEEDMEVTEDMDLGVEEDMVGAIASVKILSPADDFELESSERVTFSLELEVRDTDDNVIVDGYTPMVTVEDELVATLEGPTNGEYTLIGATPGATELVVAVGEQRASSRIKVDAQVLGAIRFEQGIYRYFFRGEDSSGEANVLALSEKGLPIEPFPEDICTREYGVGDGRILDSFPGQPFVSLEYTGVTSWGVGCKEFPDLEDTAMVLVEYPQQIDTLDAHSCMRTEEDDEGVMRCWGRNDHGQIGDGSLMDALEPTIVPFFDEMGITTQHIAVGANHTCMVSSAGELYCWGDNRSGQVAPSSEQTSIEDPARIAPEQRFVSVSAGDTHTCAITIDGELLCWGTGAQGQLGLGSMEETDTPSSVSEFRFFRVDAGPTHTCAVSFDKRLFCWGDDAFGKLGNGPAEGTDLPVEIAVENSGGAGNVRFEHVIVGEVATCAIPAFTPEGAPSRFYCWGRGELFENALVDPNNMMSFEPQTTPKIVTWPGSTTDSPDNLQRASLGTRHGCVLAGNSLHCWGLGDYGQLGRGDYSTNTNGNNEIVTPRPELLRDVEEEPGLLANVKFNAVAAGELHTCALDDNDSLACWGYAGNGRLGNGETGIEPFDGDSPSYSLPVVDVAVGREHLCVLNPQNAFCFGNNFYQQAFEVSPPRRLLGPGTVDGKSEAGTIPPLKNIEAGEHFTIGILSSETDRRLYGWGANGKDQVDSSANSLNLPGARNPNAKINTALEPITAGYDHVCTMVTVNGSNDPDATALICWGDDEHGQLGSPADQNGAFVEVTGLHDMFELTLLDAGDDITCAAGHIVDMMLMPMGSQIHCWGKGVGNWAIPGANANALEPKLIKTYPPQQEIVQLSVGGGHACALLDNGTLECWGRNDFHQATSSDEPLLTEPTEVVPPTDRVFTDITTGHQHTCALAELPGDPESVPQKYVYCWGDNRLGQSGLEEDALDGNHVREEPYLLEPPRPPQQLTREWQPRRIVAGWATTCALIQENFPNDGENYKVHCWGNNSHGQAHQRKDSEMDRNPQLELYPALVWPPAMP